MHLAERDDERELLLGRAHLESRPAAYDLQVGQDDAGQVHVADEDVAGDLAHGVEEGQVEGLVLQPGQLEVALHVGAVGVAVAQVAVVVVLVVGAGQVVVGADADWKRDS